MKKISETIFNESDNKGFNVLDNILRSTGWPKAKIKDDKAYSEDEDTVIEFSIDEYTNNPFISKIECNFLSADPAHLRDLNGLVDLFKKISEL